MSVAERIRGQLRADHADCDPSSCFLGRLWTEDIQDVLTLAAPTPDERAERVDTVAQLVHQYRHRDEQATTCGECRAVADSLARVLLGDSP